MVCLVRGNKNYIYGNDSHYIVYQNMRIRELMGFT